MCGISGCLNNQQNAMINVVSALNKLQNRGYDSAGICTIVNNELTMCKNVSSSNENAMQKLNNDPLSSSKCDVAIGHTRWATHGPKTIENAHPHYDNDKRFAIVHNGIIENYMELKEELQQEGYHFYGQTDTEIVANYLSLTYQKNQNINYLQSCLKGSWAILILDRLVPNRIYFIKNGSPLIAGFNKERTKIMFVSELIGFDGDIIEYFVIADNECGYVELVNGVCHIRTKNIYQYLPVTNLSIEQTPEPYKHWTLKEINDQPKAISKLISERLHSFDSQGIKKYNLLFPELESIIQKINEIDHLIFLACGTSYHAAQLGTKFFKEFGSHLTMEVIDGADFEETDIPQHKNCMLILLSQSGETKDLYRALQIGKEKNILSLGLINVENSLIAREVDCCLYLRAGREHAVASTKSFTNQVVMLLMVALWMNNKNSDVKDHYLRALDELENDFKYVISKTSYEIPNILPYFKNQNDCFILGKHYCEWIAKEGALKIKEITYVHAEGFSAAALKHGPFALLTTNVPVVLIANNDKFYSKIENVTAEVKSRLANVVYITNKMVQSQNIDLLLHFDTHSVLFPLLSIVPLQMISYYLALERGNHPDYPRNLAKVVTVE